MAVLGILLFFLFFWLIHKCTLLVVTSISEYFIYYFLGIVANIIPAGYFLSAINQIDKPQYWGLSLIFMSTLEYLVLKRKYNGEFSFKGQFQNDLKSLCGLWNSSGSIEKYLFGSLAFFLLICTGINVLVLFISYPNEWDSMTGHLVKCAYYLQNGNMDRVQGTTWSIDYYPNSLPTLQIFGYHFFGEKGFKLIHYFSYWVFVLSTYGISKMLFRNQKGAIFAAFMAALLPSALIQAVTTETDIVQSAYLGLVVYFLLKAHFQPNWQNLFALVLSISIWISHKVTFLLIGPAVFLIGLYILVYNAEIRKKLLPLIGLLVIGLAVYVYPNGYIGNLKEAEKFSIGALSAPPEVMKWHGIEGYSASDKIRNLELNIFRYSSDFLQLDGLRNTEAGKKVNEAFRYLPNKFFARFNLERPQFWVVFPFEMMGNPQMKFYRERPFWGIISFLFVLPIFLLLFIGFLKERKQLLLPVIFIFAAGVHFLSLCFSAPYDPIKGRYFMNMAVWCLPLLAYFFVLNRDKVFLLIGSLFIGISAIFTLSHRGLYPLVGENSIFKLDRIAQLNVTRPEGTEAYYNFEKLVPKDATVALGTQQEHEDYVYPLWGAEFKRTLIPIHPFRAAVKPIPSSADYLFYSEGVIPFKEGDVLLGKGDQLPDTPVPESKFYLRKLK